MTPPFDALTQNLERLILSVQMRKRQRRDWMQRMMKEPGYPEDQKLEKLVKPIKVCENSRADTMAIGDNEEQLNAESVNRVALCETTRMSRLSDTSRAVKEYDAKRLH